jgi:UPF0755 protein
MTGNLYNRLKTLFKFRQFNFKKFKFKQFKLRPLSLRQINFNAFIFRQLKFTQFKLKHLIILSGIIMIVVFISLFYNIYNKIYEPNTEKTTTLYLPTGSDYPKVLTILKESGMLRDIRSFNWLAHRKMYPSLVKPGAYKIEKGWNNNLLIDKLRSGAQTPVNVTFNNIRFREDLAGVLDRHLEPDSVSFLTILNNDSLAKHYGFTHENFTCLFIPNTYEFYWTTTPLRFVARMKREYNIFWNESRRTKAAILGLSPQQVITLASIVQDETGKNDEKPRISGVYINRLRRGWLLQADPTIKYAMNDFSIRRILDDYLKINSPYNTYKYAGLPPGPINFPEIPSIDAVLNAETHEYMYFCAKDDFSGYHAFAVNEQEQQLNAQRYHAALDRRGIK